MTCPTTPSRVDHRLAGPDAGVACPCRRTASARTDRGRCRAPRRPWPPPRSASATSSSARRRAFSCCSRGERPAPPAACSTSCRFSAAFSSVERALRREVAADPRQRLAGHLRRALQRIEDDRRDRAGCLRGSGSACRRTAARSRSGRRTRAARAATGRGGRTGAARRGCGASRNRRASRRRRSSGRISPT